MTGVAVIGNAGGGKSTMCRKLGQALDLAVYPVDQIQWKPGWVRTAAAEFKQRHEEWLARERWIIAIGSPKQMRQFIQIYCSRVARMIRETLFRHSCKLRSSHSHPLRLKYMICMTVMIAIPSSTIQNR
jgi:adenylate kinase family enzyme